MSTPTFEDDLDLHAMVSRDFERTLASIASDLREFADRLDHVKAPRSGTADPGFGAVAATVTRDLMNMMPNLGVSMLVHAAAQADTSILRTRKAVETVQEEPKAPDLDPRIVVGSTVRDLTDPAYTGTVASIQEGGYGVLWDLGPGIGLNAKGVYAAADEVEFVEPGEVQR